MSGRLTHAGLVLFTAASLVMSPVLTQAQAAQAQNTQTRAPEASTSPTPQQNPPQYVPPTPGPAPTPAEAKPLKLSPDYSEAPPFFPPHITAPYVPHPVAEPVLTNSPRLDQLIQNGKLNLTLEDAVSLALENNLAIAVSRYTPWLDEANLLYAKSGANGRELNSLLGADSLDPVFTSALNVEQVTTPVNNPILSGSSLSAGTSTSPTRTPVTATANHITNVNLGFAQNFVTGTQFTMTFNTIREASSLSTFLLNPFVQTTMNIQVLQPLLNGRGILPNTRYIIEAKNTIKVGESQFAQQVIATVTQSSNDYWELVFARENVKVQQVAVAADQQLYENNKKQLEIGTMAPLDVITAESQLASDQQVLVQAQSTQLQDETVLLNDITKNPLAGSLIEVELVPTTSIFNPETENIAIQDAVKEAWQKRPELQQIELNLKNTGVEVKFWQNDLLPTLNAFAFFQSVGLGGNERAKTSVPTGAFSTSLLSPVFLNGGVTEPSGAVPTGYVGSAVDTTSSTVFPGGFGDDFSGVFTGRFPTFEAGLTLTLPIRNRAAQAQSAIARIDQRQQEAQYQQEQNTIFLAVRNALIALNQDRTALRAAATARDLAQQSYDDEVKKFQLGTSTAFTVTQKQQLLTAAQGTELRDRINLIEAEVNFNQAMGRTLEVNRITVSDAKSGNISPTSNIPGTPDMGNK